MSDDQMDFEFYSKLAPSIDPADRCREPVVWFERVALLRQLDNATDSLVREIELRRGLNIVWAPPEEPADEVQLYGEGLAGHASGKTLFCRILRYLLGEETFGPDTLQKAVDSKFLGDLWAVGEVHVNGQLWLAARPLAGRDKHRQFAIRGCTIARLRTDQPAHERYSTFTDAVQASACAPWWGFQNIRDFAGWKHLLPWLARDQECRFAALTDWRKSTLSNAPLHSPSVAAQQELMRAALGLLDEHEQKARAELVDVEAKLETAENNKPAQEADWNRDWGRLKRSLNAAEMNVGDDEEPDEVGKLVALEARTRKTGQGLSEAVTLAKQHQPLLDSRKIWEEAQERVVSLRGRIKTQGKTVSDTEEKWKEVRGKIQTNREKRMQDVSRIEQGYCPHTIEHARDRGCVPRAAEESLETAAHIGDLELESEGWESLITSQKAELARLQSELDQAEARSRDAFTAYTAESESIQRTVGGYEARQQRLSTGLERFPEAKEAFTELATTKDTVKTKTERRVELKAEIEGYRKLHEDLERKLSEYFADAVRAVMGGKIEAQLELTERGFKLTARRNGDLSGAALETIKVLAFDLASLVFSVTGRGHHPRFLIHDGPREADMARVIYERFFLYLRRLEEKFTGNREPNFQYIVTTTTPPPKAMQRGSKWLRLELNTTDENERLLRKDL